MVAVDAPSPPIPNQGMNDGAGLVTRPWRRFFQLLWERTGGPNDNVNGAAPTGEIKFFGGSTAPEGYALCDGSAISRTDFSELFGVIGTTFGAGDGSTTFNVPDLRGRAAIGAGQGSGLTNRPIGDTGGAETVTLTQAELPNYNLSVTDTGHSHNVTDTGHSHGVTDLGHNHDNGSNSFVNDAAGTEYDNINGDKGTTNADTGTKTTGVTVNSASTGVTVDSATTGISVSSGGSDDAHENMMPFLAVTAIIKT